MARDAILRRVDALARRTAAIRWAPTVPYDEASRRVFWVMERARQRGLLAKYLLQPLDTGPLNGKPLQQANLEELVYALFTSVPAWETRLRISAADARSLTSEEHRDLGVAIDDLASRARARAR